MKRIAIVGGGVGGMSAAHDLRRAGHEVTIFEASDALGGLARGIREPGWDWSVEHYYHHWFTSDHAMLGLLTELGLRDRVIFRRPLTVMYYNGDFYPLDSVSAVLRFPGFNFTDTMRFGLVTAYLRYLAPWQPLEKYTADEWLARWYGPRVYGANFELLLQGKFGDHYKEVNMAWYWARFKARSQRLGTFQGGFQAFVDAFEDVLRREGVNILLSTRVSAVNPQPGGGLVVDLGDRQEAYDMCLVTLSPALLARVAPALPGQYLQGLLSLKSMGAVVMLLSLSHALSTHGYYWFNLPKSAGFPFLALVEHTNFVPAEHFGGDHLIYCGDYLDTDHEYFRLSQEELLQRFLPALKRVNPQFEPGWVKKSWLSRTPYAQPIPLVNHSKNIPAIRTPLAGLYFASMSQVYPWDRGTNYAVQIARQAAQLMLADAA